MKTKQLFYGCILSLWMLIPSISVSAQKTYQLNSPNKKLQLVVTESLEGTLTYQFTANGKLLIQPSSLGITLKDNEKVPSKDWAVTSLTRRSQDASWKPVWGKRTIVPDQFNELILDMEGQSNVVDKIQILFRAYNDGIAFQYKLPSNAKSPLQQVSEQTQYHFAGDYTAWFYNGERHNIGPKKLSEYNGKFLPVMTIKAGKNHYLALHEAHLVTGVPLTLKTSTGTTCMQVGSPLGTLNAGDHSAWRVILYGETPGQMVDSHLIELLNPAPATGSDFSWVKPGVSVWDWRIDGAEVDGFKYGMNYPSWIRMVDFASEQGLTDLVLDANWYGPEHESGSDPIAGDKANDVQKLLHYAKTKGVGVWLYLNDVAGRTYSIEETLKQYGRWGAAGVKYGFMHGSPVEKNKWTQRITELCAENHLLVNFHDGPVHPYGQMRTWPNAITREFCHAQLDAHRVFQPKTFVTTVFVNMLAGPIDMNNGMFDLRQGKTTRVDESQPVPSTLVSEAARTLIVFSGATILPDTPESYKKYPALLRFISAQKMPWKESKTLGGEIGEYIIMMRETEDAYLIGVATNEDSRTLQVPLSFLPSGSYSLECVQDGADAHYLTNRETLNVEKHTVTAKSNFKVKLAPGGGATLLIQKK